MPGASCGLRPKARSVLEIGARDGRVTRLLSERYFSVLALDLQRPAFEFPHVTTAAGDVRSLQFPDRSFDLVLCTEVLEYVPELQSATRELCRVARRHILVRVPHRQDLRHDRTTCTACGHRNPPYGHVHAFDEQRLFRLFPGWLPSTITRVGEIQDRTSGLPGRRHAHLAWPGQGVTETWVGPTASTLPSALRY
jgi:SAM-dependent methyltransferase